MPARIGPVVLSVQGDEYIFPARISGIIWEGATTAVAADGVGGLPISDAGGLDLDTKLANTNEITVARMGALTDWINGGRLDLRLDAIPTTAMRGTDSAATAANLATVDTEAGQIKAKTDDMVFTKANELDVNTKSINDAEVVGDGNGVPWDGA